MAIILISSLNLSCISDDNEPEEGVCGENDNFPYMKEGNQWTYQLESFFMADAEMIVTIAEPLEPGMFKVSINSDLISEPIENIWYSCGDNISQMNSATDDPLNNIFRKNDPAIGTIWEGNNNNDVGRYEVIDKNVNVTTDAGSFVCDKIIFHIEDAINVDTIYESSSYGTIKYDGLFLNYELSQKNF
ncbi:hypothetical protein ADICYQ_2872 [Cyclobacterium qasimii M12-11B]|uniref:Uncharacterized protein n=1 Tax=Cyclobacterium qasimii M12-11B TaxID=641524 RepID=S7VF33_9BACT|nr:hypothetical protein ADICYQ_2872 [Cyclobacterium qasimii M12-11B]